MDNILDDEVITSYLVIPGTVQAVVDGDIHYVSAAQLMSLYKVSPARCVVMPASWDTPRAQRRFMERYGHLPRLRPRADGCYNVSLQDGTAEGSTRREHHVISGFIELVRLNRRLQLLQAPGYVKNAAGEIARWLESQELHGND